MPGTYGSSSSLTSLGGLHSLQSFVGRPSLRWIPWCLALAISLWVFGPFALHLSDMRRPGHLSDGPDWNRNQPFHSPRPPPLHSPTSGPPSVWSGRANQVRDAFIHAYSGYWKHAFPHDELLPVTGGKINNFNGWGVSVFDSLDTMWIMGLHDTFQDAQAVIARSNFTSKEISYTPFFETVIRYLGGVLSAYALSGEPVFLSRADDLGRLLLPAFKTPSGFPMYAVNMDTGHTKPGWTHYVLWAEAFSNQLEYKYLAHITGRTEYYRTVERAMTKMYDANITDGLFPTMWDVNLGTPSNTRFSVGAFADSAHEYLLKQWLLSGESEPRIRTLYIKSTNAIIDKLLFLTPKRKLLYVTDIDNGIPSHTFEHLSCFLPGVLALGVQTLKLLPRDKQLHEWVAHGLAYTCWMTYVDQATGLGPDEMKMDHWPEQQSGRWMDHVDKWEKEGRPGGRPPGLQDVPAEGKENRDYSSHKPAYLLRPETVESFYILWRTTGDVQWRERGWSVFEAIQKHARTEYGYASLNNVDDAAAALKDEMPSYFLAETLKYLFLLFTEDDLIPLDKWVFNTEAHPLPIFHWSNWEKEEYDITP